MANAGFPFQIFDSGMRRLRLENPPPAAGGAGGGQQVPLGAAAEEFSWMQTRGGVDAQQPLLQAQPTSPTPRISPSTWKSMRIFIRVWVFIQLTLSVENKIIIAYISSSKSWSGLKSNNSTL
jgi:hypothetical protein